MAEGLRMTVVGAINSDFTARVQRAPARGETIGDGVLEQGPGGKGANQAVAATRLGASVRLVGAVGLDAEGARITGHLSGLGVDVTGVQRQPYPTGTALIVLDADGENSIVVCPGANAAIEPGSIRIAPGDVVLAQLEVSDAVIDAVCKQAKGFVALNVSPARRLDPAVTRRVDLFILNETEYEQSPELHDARLLAVTLGARGAVLFANGVEVARADGTPAIVLSTVGAGDAFAAALVIGIASGDHFQDALQRACAVGAAAVNDTHSQPRLDDLYNY